MQVPHSLAALAKESSQAQRLIKLLSTGQLARSIAPGSHFTTQQSIVLLALGTATTTSNSSKLQFVEKIKQNMLKHGALERVCKVVCRLCGADDTDMPSSSSSDSDSTPAIACNDAWQLYMCFLVLENVTFTCPDNGKFLTQLMLPFKHEEEVPLVALLVRLLPHLQQGYAAKKPYYQQCVHACLAVLMNLTHQNKTGVDGIMSAGGLPVVSQLLMALLAPWHEHQDKLRCKVCTRRCLCCCFWQCTACLQC